MSFMILNATRKTANISGQAEILPFAGMRKKTLENLKAASETLRVSNDDDLNTYNAVFGEGGESTMLPFWNLANGPIADCIWHVGQIVSFRRSSGNPFNEKVDVFRGIVVD
jgi:hypothetical protein